MTMTRPCTDVSPPSHAAATVLGPSWSLIGFIILISLGEWQLQRLKWKGKPADPHRRRCSIAAAAPLDEVLSGGGDLDYVRVTFDCPDLMSGGRACGFMACRTARPAIG